MFSTRTGAVLIPRSMPVCSGWCGTRPPVRTWPLCGVPTAGGGTSSPAQRRAPSPPQLYEHHGPMAQ
eukprot:10345878-Alexandrium_andersonii.AAC.1